MPAVPPLGVAAHLRRLMAAELELRIARQAVATGALTAARLDEATAEAEADGRGVLAVLAARGWLDDATVARLRTELAREDFSRPALRVTEPPPEVKEAAADPTRRVGAFVLVALAGRGGASEVWKAWDTRLERWVAVKISTASVTSAAARDRFEREALAVARLRHPHILPVFEFGTDRDRPYLVMPFIEGRTLSDAGLPLDRAVAVMHDVARAVAHAHECGVLHRDLKPANVMLGDDGQVYVLDFGLVYLLGSADSAMTRPGDLLGTAGYMAPEQAVGESEARQVTTDVYGLGATLYFLATGRPPFTGDTFAATVAQAIHGEPTPPRSLVPTLPRDLEAVILKAMEKEPRRRHPTAAALADDLAALGRGEPVSARAPGPVARAARAVRRRPWLFSTAAAAIAVVAIGILGAVRVAAERRAAVDAIRDVARLSLDTALRLRRAGDVAGMRAVLPNVTAAYERARTRAPNVAEVEYLMGRMYRALLDEERALQHQEAALARDPDYGPAVYERAVLLSRRYGRELGRVRSTMRLEGPGAVSLEDAERRAPALRQLREAIQQDGRRLEALPLGEARVLAARAILAHHQGDHLRARETLKQVVAREPTMEEAWETLAQAAEASAAWRTAERAYAEGLKHDRGNLSLLVGRCGMWAHLGAGLEKAIDDASAVIAAEPRVAEAWRCRANARTMLGHREMLAGRDALSLYAAAERDYGEALAREPRLHAALAGRAQTRRYRALHGMRYGGDPVADLDASEADLTAALALDQGVPTYWSSRGRTRSARGHARELRGEDFLADLDAAEADFSRALQIDEKRWEAMEWRGEARTRRAAHRLARGEDPLPDLAAAEADFDRAIAGNGGQPWTHHYRGLMLTVRGRVRAARGEAPDADWAAADAAFTEATRRSGDVPDFWTAWGALRRERASRLRGGAAAGEREAARADVDRALALNATHAEAWLERGQLAQAGGDGAGARAAYARAVEINPLLARRVPQPP